MTVSNAPSRPWYCIDPLVEDYLTIEREGGDLKVLKSLKILRAIVVNVGIIAITVLALLESAEPTVIGGIGLTSLAAYNGVEILDYRALAQAVVEAGNSGDDGS